MLFRSVSQSRYEVVGEVVVAVEVGVTVVVGKVVVGEVVVVVGVVDEVVVVEFVAVDEDVVGEVDDMAMLRVLARSTNAYVLVPTVVVRDELRQGVLQECVRIPDLYEDFFAIGIKRHFEHPLIKTLLERKELDV